MTATWEEDAWRTIHRSIFCRGLGLPILAEGYPNSDYTFWAGVFVPAGTPREILQCLHDAVAAALDDPELKQRMTALARSPCA
jgi:tripartite-type tricarboxylate transporter receptor subunit TctC